MQQFLALLLAFLICTQSVSAQDQTKDLSLNLKKPEVDKSLRSTVEPYMLSLRQAIEDEWDKRKPLYEYTCKFKIILHADGSLDSVIVAPDYQPPADLRTTFIDCVEAATLSNPLPFPVPIGDIPIEFIATARCRKPVEILPPGSPSTAQKVGMGILGAAALGGIATGLTFAAIHDAKHSNNSGYGYSPSTAPSVFVPPHQCGFPSCICNPYCAGPNPNNHIVSGGSSQWHQTNANGSTLDNYSSPGAFNPWTGKRTHCQYCGCPTQYFAI
jgi:hypothetical protein